MNNAVYFHRLLKHILRISRLCVQVSLEMLMRFAYHHQELQLILLTPQEIHAIADAEDQVTKDTPDFKQHDLVKRLQMQPPRE